MASARERLRFELNARVVAIIGVMIAIVFVATRFISVTIPGPGGYVHLGDIVIFFAAFVFGPVVGGIAGAFGTALSDLHTGAFANYAPGSFVIHGLQGVVAGLIAWRGGLNRMLLATIAGGAIIVGGYFIYDLLILRLGTSVAVTDIWFNLGQAASGAIVAIPLVLAIRQAYPPIMTWSYRQIWHEESS